MIKNLKKLHGLAKINLVLAVATFLLMILYLILLYEPVFFGMVSILFF